MKRNRIWLVIIVLGLLVLEHCNNIEIEPIPETVDRYPVDSVEVLEYFQKKGYALESTDTSSSRAYYLVLDEGDGELIEDFDIVTINYTIRTSDDSILWTSRRADAIEYGLFVVDTLGYFGVDTLHEDSVQAIETISLDTLIKNGVFDSVALAKLYAEDIIDTVVLLTDTLTQYDGGAFVGDFKLTVTSSTWSVPEILGAAFPFHQAPFEEALVGIIRGSRVGAKGVMILLSERYYGGGSNILRTGLLIVEVYPTFVRKASS